MSTPDPCARLLACVLALTTAATCAADGPAPPATSEWVHPGPDGKLQYKTTPAGDRIMDFSHAGYMGGGVALPDVPIKRTVKPTGGDDDTRSIQAAIDEVAKLPIENSFRGAVLLAPGVFTCAGTINISVSGIVLRGSGSGAGGKSESTSTIKMIGKPHLAISVRGPGGRGRRGMTNDPESASSQASTDDATLFQTTIADAYVPSGTNSFRV